MSNERSKRFFPVVHISTEEQTLRNVEIANKAGADGVFLINHGNVQTDLMEVITKVHQEFPDVWLGVNRLGTATEDAFNVLPPYIKGVWADNAHIHSGPGGELSLDTAEDIDTNKRRAKFNGLYFGGFAFKYTQQPDNLEDAAKWATWYIDVITTSGAGTGHAADIEKVKAIHEAVEGHPLAIASGITPDNVEEFLPYIDDFLVATGISDSFHELNADLTRELRDRIKS